jgi:hypothetical protein
MGLAGRKSVPSIAGSVLVVLALLVVAATAFGRAETGTFGPDVNQISDTVDDSGTCLGPGATGTITGTETVVGHFSETGPPALNFHAHGTSTVAYRVDYADGRYVLGTSVEHFTDIGNVPQIGSGSVTRDTGTLYGPGGQTLGPVTIHAVSHIAFKDANGNFQPDPGEFTANFDRFRLTCPK